MQKPIKMVSYNILNGRFVDKVLAFLKQEQADIVCVQEVAQHGLDFAPTKRNLYAEIGKALGMKGEYRQMFWADNGRGVFDLGIASFSRFPVLNTVTFHYERQPTNEVLQVQIHGKDRYNIPRVLLGIQVQVEQTALWVMAMHHTITSDGGVTEHQLETTRKVKDFLKTYDSYILCGDMNTPYGNENYRLLAEGLRDVSLPGKPSLHPNIHTVGYMGYHVDYVFFKGKSLRHDTSRIPLVDASDHLPVVVSFFLDQ